MYTYVIHRFLSREINKHTWGRPKLYMYGVYIQYFWQGNHQIYGHIQCVYMGFWSTLNIRSYKAYMYGSGQTYVFNFCMCHLVPPFSPSAPIFPVYVLLDAGFLLQLCAIHMLVTFSDFKCSPPTTTHTHTHIHLPPFTHTFTLLTHTHTHTHKHTHAHPTHTRIHTSTFTASCHPRSQRPGAYTVPEWGCKRSR